MICIRSSINISASKMSTISLESKSQPNLVCFEKWKYLFVCYRILISNYQKLLVESYELRNILTEK